jgi:hypothetical protein
VRSARALVAVVLLVPALAGAEMPDAIEQRCPCHGPQPGKRWEAHDHYVFCVGAVASELSRQGKFETHTAAGLVQSAIESECGARRASGPCGGSGGASCEAGYVCDVTDPGCHGDDRPGRCARILPKCPSAKEPVCGCDGVSYGNDCERLQSGAILAHRGACVEKCGGAEAKSCPEGQLCNFPTGSCGEDDRQGECASAPKKPCACTKRYDPVCGCDGQDYPNPCEARCAGVSLRKRGKCPTG